MLAGGGATYATTPALSANTPRLATDPPGVHSHGVSPENAMPQHRTASNATPAHLSSHDRHSTAHPHMGGTADAARSVASPRHARATEGNLWVPNLSTVRDRDHENRGTDSLPPSRSGSEAPEDILGAEEIINPLGSMSKMAGLVEAAVERAREEENRSDDDPSVASLKRSRSRENLGSRKARRGSQRVIIEAQGLPQPVTDEGPKPRTQKAHIHSLLDVVDEGMVSEEEARELMAIYFQGSSHFVPCYDPQHDTWDS